MIDCAVHDGTVDMTGGRFVRCVFVECWLVFDSADPPIIINCTFENSRVQLSDQMVTLISRSPGNFARADAFPTPQPEREDGRTGAVLAARRGRAHQRREF